VSHEEEKSKLTREFEDRLSSFNSRVQELEAAKDGIEREFGEYKYVTFPTAYQHRLMRKTMKNSNGLRSGIA